MKMESPKTNSFVRGIMLDFDNTLVDTKGADFKALDEVKKHLTSVDSSVDAVGVISNFQTLLRVSEKDPNGVVPIDEWRTNLWSKALGDVSNGLATETHRLWKGSRLKGISFTPEIRSLLMELKEKYKLLLLTNGDSQVQREKLDQCEGWGYFHFVMISGDFPYEKPNPAIFEEALRRMQVTKDECIMVGDSLGTDIQGGINAGMTTVWVNPQQSKLDDNQPKPSYHITSVLQLNDVLDKLNKSR